MHNRPDGLFNQQQQKPRSEALTHLPNSPSTMHNNNHAQRLAAGEWFTSRVSACGLFTVAYPRVPAATRSELRGLFTQLARDETPMVRRAAAQRLGAFAGAVERDLVARELLPLFTDLTGDGALRFEGCGCRLGLLFYGRGRHSKAAGVVGERLDCGRALVTPHLPTPNARTLDSNRQSKTACGCLRSRAAAPLRPRSAPTAAARACCP
jgi:hypothetical protein